MCYRCNVKHNSLLCGENPKNQEPLIANVGTTNVKVRNGKKSDQNKEKKNGENKRDNKE